MKNVNAILCSDMHLREDVPECRTDDFIQAMIDSLEVIGNLQKETQAPVICAGDIFNYWKASPALLYFALQYLPTYYGFYSIVGQHDLKNHNYSFICQTGFGVLRKIGKIKELCPREDIIELKCNNNVIRMYGYPYGYQLPKKNKIAKKIQIQNKMAVCHTTVWKHKEPWPDAVGNNAPSILQRFPEYQLVLTGDNHEAFTYKNEKGQLLVNPGSMMRTTADQYNFKPRVYLWDMKENEVEPFYLPIKKEAVSREHIINKKNHDHRIDSFVRRLNEKVEVGFNFEKNMKI